MVNCPLDSLKILQGDDVLSLYQWNTPIAVACERVLEEIVTRSLLKRGCRSDGTRLEK